MGKTMVERILGLLMRIWWRHDSVILCSTLLASVTVNGLLDLGFILLAGVFLLVVRGTGYYTVGYIL
jgi:hypothetical protein